MWMMFVVSLCLFFLCENIHTRFLLRFNQTLARESKTSFTDCLAEISAQFNSW